MRLIELFTSEKPPSAKELDRELGKAGFSDPRKAWDLFRGLSRRAAAPMDKSFEELLPLLLNEIGKSADPDLAAVHFTSFIEKLPDPLEGIRRLLANPGARKTLVQACGSSPILAAALQKQPELLGWLVDEGGLYRTFSEMRMREVIQRYVGQADGWAEKLNALRREKRRRMLRIGMRDLLGLDDVKALTYELSCVADACLEAALGIAREELFLRHPAPDPAWRFVVYGMGKLGGHELNYSSDVDLLFMYDGVDEKDPERRGHLYFNDLAEHVIRAVAEPTHEGSLFRVDMRLRPEGMGDMAKSLDAYLDYYETRADPWERQALLKARPCAGDLELGRGFLSEVEPLIFRKSLDHDVVEETRAIMRMIEEKMARKGLSHTQVKLGRGGIREVEFIVQLLQLLHGGARPQVRAANTLEGLEALQKDGLLVKADALFLADAYRFLRDVEHRLQLVYGLQTHTLPKAAKDLESLARRMGFTPRGGLTASRQFTQRYHDVTERVRSLYEEVFRIRGKGDPTGRVAQAAWEGDKERVVSALPSKLFFDPPQAATNLVSLSARLKKTAGPRGELLWARFAPELLKGLKRTAHPGRALNQLESFLRATSLPDLYVRYLLEKPKLLELLLELFSDSLFLSENLIVNPGNIDVAIRAVGAPTSIAVQEYLEGLEERLAEAPDWEAKLDLLREMRGSETLRIGLTDLLGKRDIFDVFGDLSRLAIALSRSALGVAAERVGLPCREERPRVPEGFCLMAMGKLAGREMNYGSDLDLLFVYADEASEREGGMRPFLDLAETFITAMESPTGKGRAYRVDAKLRPMGREAPLVHSVQAYRNYFVSQAEAWERLAYTRALFLAGDRQVGAAIQEAVREFVYGRGLTRKEYEECIDIRRAMADGVRQTPGLEIKASEGGLNDIEFFVQLMQLSLGQASPDLAVPHVSSALKALGEKGLAPPDVIGTLEEAYRFFRRVEARHRMVRETGSDVLPQEEPRFARLAKRLGYGNKTEALREDLRTRMERVRAVFDRLAEWLKFTD